MNSTEASKSKAGMFFRRFGIDLVLVVMVIVAGILEPTFLSVRNITNVFRQISVNGLIAIGMTFVIISGGIDLSVGSLTCLLGILVIAMQQTIHFLPAIIVVLALGFGIGALNGMSIAKGMPAFIMTLATMTSIRGVAYLLSNGQPVSGTQEGFNLIGQGYVGILPLPVLIYIGMVVLAFFVLMKTRFGRGVYAVGGNAETARLSGINVRRTTILIYAISGLMVAIASIVVTARLTSTNPTLGDGYELDAIASVVIGGTAMTGGEGSVLKTVIGALIIGCLSNILNLMDVSPYMQQVVKGLIIFLAVASDTWRKKD